VLTDELQGFQVKVETSSHGGHARFEHRQGEHDDLVLALAMALWYAEHGEVTPRITFH
jgi:hypothetical protein